MDNQLSLYLVGEESANPREWQNQWTDVPALVVASDPDNARWLAKVRMDTPVVSIRMDHARVLFHIDNAFTMNND